MTRGWSSDQPLEYRFENFVLVATQFFSPFVKAGEKNTYVRMIPDCSNCTIITYSNVYIVQIVVNTRLYGWELCVRLAHLFPVERFVNAEMLSIQKRKREIDVDANVFRGAFPHQIHAQHFVRSRKRNRPSLVTAREFLRGDVTF